MRDIEGSYRALLAVTNALNSQRDTDGLWRVITEQIKKVVPWDRAGVTLYNAESDSFRFYVVETSMPMRVLQRDAVIPRAGSAVGWVYEHRRLHVRPDLKRERVFVEDEVRSTAQVDAGAPVDVDRCGDGSVGQVLVHHGPSVTDELFDEETGAGGVGETGESHFLTVEVIGIVLEILVIDG